MDSRFQRLMRALALGVVAVTSLWCLLGEVEPDKSARATPRREGRAAVPEAAASERSGGAPPASGADVVSAGAPVDIIAVLLLHTEGDYALQTIAVYADGRIVRQAEIRLPESEEGRSYAGPVATSADSYVVIGWEGSPQQVTAYQWRPGAKEATQIGSPSRTPWPDYVPSCGMKSYSRISTYALVFPCAGERLADPPWLWRPGARRWIRPEQAYPALRVIGKKLVLAAAYSPDGSLLAVAVIPAVPADNGGPPPEIRVYDPAKRSLRSFRGPRRSVWALAISPDNSELCWTEPGSPGERGFGVLSLNTGKHRYWRVARQTSLPKAMRGPGEWPGTEQTDDNVAFSGDGRRIYFSSWWWLVAFDRSSGQWQVIWKNEPGSSLQGFAILPADAQPR